MYSFGSGVLLGTRTDIANATPVNFGLVQEVTVDETATIKELTGQFQRPVAIACGSIKTTGKAKVARISGMAFANLYYGVTPTAGQLATSFAEADAVAAVTPFTVTVLNAATFVGDEGVLYATTGLPLTLVASAPAAGQYSVAAGVYTFNSADAGKAILATYTYTVSGTGQKFTVANQLLGTTPTFQALFYTTFQGQAISLKLNNCTSNKLSFQTKLEDFVLPEFDFSCFADAAGNVMTWSPPRPETIRLGAREWPVRPLTLRQVQEIEPILMSSAAETKGNVAAALAIVAIALGRDHVDAAASLGDIEATAPEIGAAMATVLRLGGFIETPAQGDTTLGEAQAGEVRAMDPSASISPSSTQ